MSIELEKAIGAIESKVSKLDAEERLVLDALGMILAADITAKIDQPPFHRSPLDGYAIRAQDSVGASEKTPVWLTVVETLFAGDYSNRAIGQGEALGIMTGSMLPEGCDCVIRQEDTRPEAGRVAIFQELKPFQNYCYKGEDFKQGETLLTAGMQLDAVALSVCASNGLEKISVVRKLRVSIISTGDELVKPGVPLDSGKIYDANFAYLFTRLKEFGVIIPYVVTVGDQSQNIHDCIKQAAAVSDLVITTGGVSVGEKDLIPYVMDQLGAECIFHRVAIKPGTPAMFSLFEKVPVLSLSGNPFACMSTFEILARPILSKLSGNKNLMLKRASATLASPIQKASSVRRFVRGKFTDHCVELAKGNSSGQLRSMIGCNCLIDIPAGSDPLEPGTIVSVLLL